MFVRIEGDRLVNMDLIDIVELKHRKNLASFWTGGVIQVADSSMAYAWIMQHEDMIDEPIATFACEKCSSMNYTEAERVSHVLAAHPVTKTE